MRLGNVTILTPDRRLDDHAVRIAEGRIEAIAPDDELEDSVPRMDGRGLFLVPGFIDLQVNGGFGHDFTADPSTIPEVASKLPRYGVTAFLPTILTSPLPTITKAQGVCEALDGHGAAVLGLHLEGPFLNPAKKGAHSAEYLRLPEELEGWTLERGVRLVTLAPELPGARELIRDLVQRGIVVGAGHSMASFDEARAAMADGVRYGTHLWNAMPPLAHRDPGLVGAWLTERDITVGLITDGHHVHPAMIDLVWRLKGASRLNLVSDAMAGLGMASGRFRLGEFDVEVRGGKAQLPDGTLAGSVASLDACLRVLARAVDADWPAVLPTVTSTPARLLGLDDRGEIAVGRRADLVLLGHDGQVVMTMVGGDVVYEKE